MLPLTYIHAFEAARTTAGGRGVGGGKITPPTACKGLGINENGAKVAGVHKACLCPATGRRRAFSRVLFFMAKREKCIITITI